MVSFEDRQADIVRAIRSLDHGSERDRLLIELGATVAAEEFTRPERGLAELIMRVQATATCLPGEDDDQAFGD